MNKKKLIASVLTIALLVGAAGASVYAVETSKPAGGENETSTEVEEILNQVSEEVKATGKDLTKEETVYVIADASGQVNKIIVSDWIQNGTQNAEIKDETDLEDIKNVKGNESYKMNEEGMCVWDAKGHDIYYQGTTKKALPVDVKVSYKLDGEPISADDIAGKSGKVTIRFDYTNNESKMMNVGGKQEKIYVPFAMLTGTIMDNEVFSNIEVTNGKIINEGEKTIVTGLAFPGLSDDLGVKADSDVEIPAYFEITADAKDFSMKNTVTIASNTIFDDFDTDKFDTASLKDGMDELNDGMDKLVDGSSELYDGIETLLDKSKELVIGIRKLADGAKDLRDGAVKLDSSTNTLKQGAANLAVGAQKIKDGTEPLKEGAEDLAAGVNMAASEIKKTAASMNKLGASLEGIKGGVDTAEDLADTVSGGITNVKSGVESALEALEDVDADSLDKDGKVALATAKAALTKSNSGLAGLGTAAGGIKTATSKCSGGLGQVIDSLGESKGSSSLGQIDDLVDGAIRLKNGMAELDAGAEDLVAGANQLSGGSSQLKDGTKKLADGAEKLYKGIMELDENAPLLIDGINKLADGSMELSDGLKKFRDEGLSKLNEIVDGDLGNIADRLSVTVDVAKSYNSFAGLSKDMKGSTKFIYKTDEIN